jgi:FkbM family methyltransferase
MNTPFVLASTNHGPMIVNRFDTGVSWQLFIFGVHEVEVVSFGLELILECHDVYGYGVTIIDVGANIGTCTIPWAKQCGNWGKVTAFEPQERIFYALAGNIVLNNLMNTGAIHGAVSDTTGNILIPRVDYEVASNFGGIAMKDGLLQHSPGQLISYDKENMINTKCYALDDLNLKRLDLLKIDVEGMELDVLKGATKSITRLKPVLITEWIHIGTDPITDFLKDFEHFTLGGNIISVPKSETKILNFVKKKMKK